ncbi:MAG: hypothetical protein FRX48_05100 [Lasallia pustulata]|uniref:Protein kinase domain-containing protein n=1 Tax=Lasallia pustulata TaxID=136370 RepID=A0A5M8PPD7_9LECA|nr:MAG: hypothetical protein FRX48_05100 [Lasallia pustulata]
MDVASFSFAVFQTIDLCLKYGPLLVAKYHTYIEADVRVAELILRIEGVWVITEHQIKILRRIWNTLEGRLQSYQSQVLQHLQIKLQTATIEIDGVIGVSREDDNFLPMNLGGKKGPLKKWKILAVEELLYKAVAELEEWRKRFDPSWLLIARIANGDIDRQLTANSNGPSNATSLLKSIRDTLREDANPEESGPSIFLNDTADKLDPILIPHCSALLSFDRDEGTSAIIDTTTYPPRSDMTVATLHVRNVARILSKSDPWTFGLLACRGAIKIWDSSGQISQFELVFDVPSGLQNPASLRSRLLSQPKISLDNRLHLAKSLARSVMFVHTSGFVHKNIWPETVVIFEKQGSELGFPFLVGFERFRPAAAGSKLLGDADWARNLYRHPKRQGVLPEDLYIMQHDIYSLGVCLLEIGSGRRLLTLAKRLKRQLLALCWTLIKTFLKREIRSGQLLTSNDSWWIWPKNDYQVRWDITSQRL